MANLGIIDADPSEPPSHEEVIKLANRLLGEFNIPTTIDDVGDICAALFVLLYENLFSDRLNGIIRHPVSKEDEIHNCQTVIDVLSSDIVRDSLSHIRGVDIVEGNITAISNLLDIFSYLLDYVANKIESDIGTDDEDGKSLMTADRDSYLREKDRKSHLQQKFYNSGEFGTISSRPGENNPNSHKEKIGRRSPEVDANDNSSNVMDDGKYRDRVRQRIQGGNVKEDLEPDYLDIPPSPIRPDNSQSLLGQKTIDSTELDSQFGKDEKESGKGSPTPKVAWADDRDLNDKLCDLKLKGDHASDGTSGGAFASSTAANLARPSTTNGRSHYIFTHHLYHHYDRPYYTTADPKTDMLRDRNSHLPYMSASMPTPKQTLAKEDDKDGSPFRSTIGPIDYHIPGTLEDVKYNRDRECVKGLSSSYNDLRHLVERTAAMTRVALQTSPIMSRVERDLNLVDTSDRPRPTIPSDGARRARELNAQGMRRGESQASYPKTFKKVAFSSHSDRINDRSYPQRYPLEELSDNDCAKGFSHSGPGNAGRAEVDYDGYRDVENSKSQIRRTSPDQHRRTKKSPTKYEAFANHLARSRQPELGAAHLKLKTEDRAIKKKQEFLQRLYQEDLGEFSEDVEALLDKEYHSSREKERRMLKSYKESKPLVKGMKTAKNTSKSVSSRKPQLGSRSPSTKRSSSVPRGSSSRPLKLESEEDLLPFLLDEFPHLHLSDHTWHELCRKGLHQIEAVTRVYQENKRKKTQAQIQLEEAAQRHEILSDIMRKELDHTKRLRELKEQKSKQIQVKNKTHEKRVQSARARRYYNEYQVRARSKQLKRRTREEMVFRDLFKDAITIQKERIKDIRQYASDKRKTQETRRQNEMESLENYYQDQFKMLAEKATQERKDTILRDKAQQQMMERIKQELRKKIESEINLYQEQMFRDDDDAHFRQMDADKVKRQLHMARYAAQI